MLWPRLCTSDYSGGSSGESTWRFPPTPRNLSNNGSLHTSHTYSRLDTIFLSFFNITSTITYYKMASSLHHSDIVYTVFISHKFSTPILLFYKLFLRISLDHQRFSCMFVYVKAGRCLLEVLYTFVSVFLLPRELGASIGFLDICGFEDLNNNCLEQLCINLANEHLQQFMNNRIFHQERALYSSEGVHIDIKDVPSNEAILKMFNEVGIIS